MELWSRDEVVATPHSNTFEMQLQLIFMIYSTVVAKRDVLIQRDKLIQSSWNNKLRINYLYEDKTRIKFCFFSNFCNLI